MHAALCPKRPTHLFNGLTASGSPSATFSENNSDVLPQGVTFNSLTGQFTGTPAAGTAGTYTLHFTAANGVAPDDTQTFTLNVMPDISGTWNFNGQAVSIVQTGASLTFTNEHARTSAGGFTSFTAPDSIIATDWGNMTATLSHDNTEIDWSNGSKWTRFPADITGSWKFGIAATGIALAAGQLIFTNESGAHAAGSFIAANQVEVPDWGNLIGTLSNDNQTLTWSNNSVWVHA